MSGRYYKRPQIGDWVRGKTMIGELVHGYVEHEEVYHTFIKVRVLISDNKKLIGKIVRIDEKELQIYSMTDHWTKDEITNLIDLALSTRDREWFDKLSSKVKKGEFLDVIKNQETFSRFAKK
ncbi:IDEAL domain-containing protein [Alkalihalobacillus hemicellulosilyticus]|uniref:IDEAL domain-containing protein n=1 Tax=Halalkalibacter hemicellulosilyticus TaxID=127886 RepID=UPI00068E3967|nr:IDEAL domain-containing protein [Halalkalibacter hemicellulosilyticus]